MSPVSEGRHRSARKGATPRIAGAMELDASQLPGEAGALGAYYSRGAQTSRRHDRDVQDREWYNVSTLSRG